MAEFTLHPFPVAADTESFSLHGSIGRAAGRLRIAYLLRGPLHQLLLPRPVPSARRDGLWQATCFELFWRQKDNTRYWELNLSPSGEWNAYAFSDYRAGMRQEELLPPPRLQRQGDSGLLSLTAELDLTGVGLASGALRLGISAVLAHADGQHSYWALAHPGRQPDFHAPQGFLLSL